MTGLPVCLQPCSLSSDSENGWEAAVVVANLSSHCRCLPSVLSYTHQLGKTNFHREVLSEGEVEEAQQRGSLQSKVSRVQPECRNCYREKAGLCCGRLQHRLSLSSLTSVMRLSAWPRPHYSQADTSQRPHYQT